MNDLTMIEMRATTGGASVETVPSLAPSAALLEALAALGLLQQQNSARFLQSQSD
jgi:hypothetical protein